MGLDLGKLTILLVEDTIPMQKLLHSVLDILGVGRILMAKDGEQGFQIFQNAKPDIVITDWLMDNIDGLEMIEKIRTDKNSVNPLVPIILMTGYSARNRVTSARDIGVTEFLVKPFTAADLSKRIAHVINRPRDFIECPEFFGPDRRRKLLDDYSGPLKRDEDQESQEHWI